MDWVGEEFSQAYQFVYLIWWISPNWIAREGNRLYTG